MSSKYEPIGDYIRLVDERNVDLRTEMLLGVSINKCFMPSVANVIGTDLANYKVIRKNQFACSLMQVSRDEKIPIDCLSDYEIAMVSPAYHVFEVADTEKLLPQYLAMWFKRAEFDREASFLGVGGVRGSMTWEDFCGMRLPVPPLDKQRAVVKAYQTITDRITLKRKINDNLEATAGVVYQGKYAIHLLSGELPSGWQLLALDKVANISAGGDRPLIFSAIRTEECPVPIYANGTTNDGLYGFTNNAIINDEAVTISARGTVGFTCLRQEPYFPIVRLISVVPKKKYITAKYLYFFLKNYTIDSKGTSQQQITIPDFEYVNILVPPVNEIQLFSSIVKPIFAQIANNKAELRRLQELQKLVLSELTVVFL